jgi:hypothetical protein
VEHPLAELSMLGRHWAASRSSQTRYSASMIRVILIVFELIIGAGTLALGGYSLARIVLVPRDSRRLTTHLYSLLASGLLVVIGVSMFVAAGLLLGSAKTARLVSLEVGVVFLGWVAARLSTRGRHQWLQPLMLVAGIAVVALSLVMRSPG